MTRGQRSAGWGGLAPLLAGLLGACGQAASPPGTSQEASTASGGAPAAGGSTGGTLGSGGAQLQGTGGGAAGADSGSGGTMTQAEWEAAIAPIAGPHEIWTYDSCDVPHVGSTSVRVGPEYSVVPSIGSTTAADFDAETNPVFDVVLMEPQCFSPADCTEYPDGVCQGGLADAYCQYPEPIPTEACSADTDCVARAEGSCVSIIGFPEHRLCYPTGVCEQPNGICKYAEDLPCTGDADCSERADGKCIFPVGTICAYDTCFEDADCTDGERCGCGQCVSADCASDDDCGGAETCELSPPWCLEGWRFYCTTPRDECEPGESGCSYQPDLGEGPFWGRGHCAL